MATRISMRQLMAAGRRIESGSSEIKLRKNPLAGINRSYFSKYQGHRLFIKECKNNGSGNMEVGFYNLNKLFNFNIVPKTVLVKKDIMWRNRPRTIPVVVQEFVKGPTLCKIIDDKHKVDFNNSEELSEWVFLDYVYSCHDRHDQNIIINSKFNPPKLWLIDNGHSLSLHKSWNIRSFSTLKDNFSINILKPLNRKTVKKINKVIESINHKPFSKIWEKKFIILLKKNIVVTKNTNCLSQQYGDLSSLIKSVGRLKSLYDNNFKITKNMWVR